MFNEGFKSNTETQKEIEHPFEVRQPREGVTWYIFKDLGVSIDTTGKNYKPLPELLFGPYDNELSTGSLDQPEKTKQGVDMQYASECIKKVAEVSGIHQFWVYPYSGDVADEDKEKRELARMRLFIRKSPNIQPAPGGYGYILTI